MHGWQISPLQNSPYRWQQCLQWKEGSGKVERRCRVDVKPPPQAQCRCGRFGLRGRHFVWRLLNYKDGRHGWQSWVISLTTAPCLRSAATMWTLPLALSASVASNRTSTATVDKTNSCFLELLLLSTGSQYRGSVQKQLETANGVYFQEKRTLWRCLIPDWLVHRQLLRLPKHLWWLQLSLHCHHKPWCLCACCSTKSNTDFGSDASPLQFNVYYVKKYTHLGRTWLHS